MNVLLVHEHCIVGGIETWMVDQAQILKRMGHKCELFFLKKGPFSEFIPREVKAHYGDLAECMEIVQRGRFEIVHLSTMGLETGVSAVRRLGAKVIVHGNGWARKGWDSSNCDAIFGCSEWNAREQQKYSDLPVKVIRNGVHLDRFPMYEGAVKGPPIVAWVGRGSSLHQKQIDRLAAVAPYLTKGGARLWLADPDGPEKIPAELAAILKKEAERWGRVAPAEMPGFFREVAASGGCVLSTSRFEGLSMAYLEAQASGCPVIGPDVIGVNESLDVKRGGILYPADTSATELAGLVLSTVNGAAGMEKRRRACREFAEECSFENAARTYLELYRAAPCGQMGVWPMMRSRLSVSPLISWRSYVEERWGAGNQMYICSEKLFREGKPQLARLLLKESIRVAPTLFIRRRRLAHAAKLLLRGHAAIQPATGMPDEGSV